MKGWEAETILERSDDWYSPKNCARQYKELLDGVEASDGTASKRSQRYQGKTLQEIIYEQVKQGFQEKKWIYVFLYKIFTSRTNESLCLSF